ncbi:MAG: hypothetical protein KAI74_04825 [Kiritimatiellae bacterium]|nr:hypothetical protein [Kiritimatiellia bacterium]
MKKTFTFIASGWSPETAFHASIAAALNRDGHECHAVTLGANHAEAYRETGSFTTVHDLTEWTANNWPDIDSAKSQISDAERKYDIPSYWQLLAADRFLCLKSYEFNIKTAWAQTSFWEKYIKEVKPAIFIGEVSHFHNYLAWAIGDHSNIQYAHMIPARVPQHCAMGNGPFEHRDMVEYSYRDFQANGIPDDLKMKAEEYISAFQNKTERASHLQEVKQWYRSPVGSGSLSNFIRDAKRWYSAESKFNYTITPPSLKIKTWILQLARKASMTIQGVFTPPGKTPDTEPFVLFGLHLQPESSTLIRGQFFQDMGAVVRNLALSLPAGYRLFVKEHDVMFGRRPKSFYDELKKISNIVLVSPYDSGPLLVRKAAAIATVTGTLGWDAILLGKPAIVMGEPFFANYDGAYHITDMTKLPVALRTALLDHNHNPENQKQFVASVMDNILPASMDNLWGLRESNYDNDAAIIAKALMKRIAK